MAELLDRSRQGMKWGLGRGDEPPPNPPDARTRRRRAAPPQSHATVRDYTEASSSDSPDVRLGVYTRPDAFTTYAV